MKTTAKKIEQSKGFKIAIAATYLVLGAIVAAITFYFFTANLSIHF